MSASKVISLEGLKVLLSPKSLHVYQPLRNSCIQASHAVYLESLLSEWSMSSQLGQTRVYGV
jgi:hypothetical protein